MRRTMARAAKVGVAVMLAMLPTVAFVTPASAEPVVGFTWWSDGWYTKRVPSGSVVSAYATGVMRSTDYKLVARHCLNEDMPCGGEIFEVNPNVRRSSANGYIGLTSGQIFGAPGARYAVYFARIPVSQAINDFSTAPQRLSISTPSP